MFAISVETSFQASHQLALPDGSKEPAHSHNWSVKAEVACETLDEMGVVMDFHKLRADLGDIIARFDNSRLDTIDYFRKNSESAENVAKYIHDELLERLPDGIRIASIEVGEEEGCRAKYLG
ncbi:MAG: 6-pyruvoyl trahydropterin synthase family protein [Planctomycetota bacterium]